MTATDFVLVVDDDADIREAIRRIVTTCGYLVLTASDARTALRVAQAANGPIRLLVTDVWMPGDLSASALAEQLAGQSTELRVVYISGLPKEVAVSKGLVGADVTFLGKPFTPARLVETIRATLGDNGISSR